MTVAAAPEVLFSVISLFEISRFLKKSLYVPGSTSMVSPGPALLTASCMDGYLEGTLSVDAPAVLSRTVTTMRNVKM